MRYRVTGADSKTGDEVAYEVEARDEGDARKQMLDYGVFVSSVQVIESEGDLGALSAVADSPRRKSKAISYRTTSASPAAVPEYVALLWLSTIFNALAALSGLAAVFVAINTTVELFRSGERLRGVEVFAAALLFSTALSIAFAALLCWAMGQGLAAFRDIARNSWVTNALLRRNT